MQPRRIPTYLVAGAVALLLATAQPAVADTTLSLSFAATTNSPGVAFSLNGQSATAEPGPYFFVESLPGGGQAPIATFCMEISQGVTSSSVPYTIESLTNSNTTISANNGSSAAGVAKALEALYGYYYNTWSALSGTAASNTYSAFQLAVWELVYDGTADIANPKSSTFFSAGNFQSPSSTAEAEAQTWLNNVLNNTNQGITDFNNNLPGLTLVALVNPTYQDQLWLDPTPAVSGVPAPPGIVLAGFGLFALVGRARLIRRSAAAV